MQFTDLQGTHTRTAYIPGQATAGTADTWGVLYNDTGRSIVVTAVTWVPAAAVTGDNTNYFSLACTKYSSAGVAGNAVTATKDYLTGTNSVAHAPEALTMSTTTADITLASGESVILTRTKTGTGLAQPDGNVIVNFKVK